MERESPFTFEWRTAKWRSLVADVNLWGESRESSKVLLDSDHAPRHFDLMPLDSGAGETERLKPCKT